MISVLSRSLGAQIIAFFIGVAGLQLGIVASAQEPLNGSSSNKEPVVLDASSSHTYSRRTFRDISRSVARVEIISRILPPDAEPTLRARLEDLMVRNSAFADMNANESEETARALYELLDRQRRMRLELDEREGLVPFSPSTP